MGLCVLPLSGNGDVTEGLVGAEVLEGGDHVGLEIIPAEQNCWASPEAILSGEILGSLLSAIL